MTARTMEPKSTSVDSLATIARLPRPLVFTNGVFDILHRGHVEYLMTARQLGSALVVGINSDASVRLLGKGDDRPINAESDRAAVIAALRCVDAVCLFSDQTPVGLIDQLRPDIYVKGGDYRMAELAETRLVESWGGRAQAIEFRDGFSTTRMLERIRTDEAQ